MSSHEKGWLIEVLRDTTESTSVYVEADSREEAHDLALREATKYPESYDWVVKYNMGGWSEPYIPEREETSDEDEVHAG